VRAQVYTESVALTIVHADLDAFYASVEQLDNPELKGRPVLVGGSPEARGVVAAASYEARRFGVRSAMPMGRALRLCPEAVVVAPRFRRYHEVSEQVLAIYRGITPLVEPLALDEAFLDVTEVENQYGGAGAMAQQLKRWVDETTGLAVSVGVGPNKLIAKIASDQSKPDGLLVVPPGQERQFLALLPVRAMWGVGPKTEAELVALGITTVGQLARAQPQALAARFGQRGLLSHRLANGIDERPVEMEHRRKSVGAETTFPRDLQDGPELRRHLLALAREVGQRLSQEGLAGRTVSVKLRYADFRTISRQVTLPSAVSDLGAMHGTALKVFEGVRRSEDRFRLLGVSVSGLTEERTRQLSLWSPSATVGGISPWT
jgi:DNA polymerase-4